MFLCFLSKKLYLFFLNRRPQILKVIPYICEKNALIVWKSDQTSQERDVKMMTDVTSVALWDTLFFSVCFIIYCTVS